MIIMTNKRLKIYILGSIIALSIIFSSLAMVQAVGTDTYSPSINDSFSYSGTNIELERDKQLRIITNKTDNTLIDYFDQVIETNSIQELTNVSMVINSLTSSVASTAIAVNGIQDQTGSYIKNNTNYYNIGNGLWNNVSTTDYMNPNPFNETHTQDFNYSTGTVPSSMMVGNDTMVYIGMPAVPFGDQDTQGSNSCSETDMVHYTINATGMIDVPLFTNTSQFNLTAIYPVNNFNQSEFDVNNLGYIHTHISENITWTNVVTGAISGINPSLNGTEVVLVYQLEQNFNNGQLVASTGYCSSSNSDFNPLLYFGDLSVLQLTWSNFETSNQPYTINGHDFNLNTKTYEGSNQTTRKIEVNMSLGDPGSNFFHMVNLSLDLHVTADFIYDANTGFMVEFKTGFNATITMSIDAIEMPLGNSGYTGIATMQGGMEASSKMDFILTHHSRLYQTAPSTTSTATSLTTTTTSTSNPASSSSTDQTITAAFPTFIILLAIPSFVIFRRKIKN